MRYLLLLTVLVTGCGREPEPVEPASDEQTFQMISCVQEHLPFGMAPTKERLDALYKCLELERD